MSSHASGQRGSVRCRSHGGGDFWPGRTRSCTGCTKQFPSTGDDRCTNARRAATRGLIPLPASRAVAQLG
jgi:hypothetical protein